MLKFNTKLHIYVEDVMSERGVRRCCLMFKYGCKNIHNKESKSLKVRLP